MNLTAKELIAPAKTQGELMSYRKGYSAGLAHGKRHSETLGAALNTLMDAVQYSVNRLDADGSQIQVAGDLAVNLAVVRGAIAKAKS